MLRMYHFRLAEMVRPVSVATPVELPVTQERTRWDEPAVLV
jgi:hypothetical protein